MKKDQKTETFFPNPSESEKVDQWFPNQPSKSPSKLWFFIALLDEIFIVGLVIFTIYMIYKRFG